MIELNNIISQIKFNDIIHYHTSYDENKLQEWVFEEYNLIQQDTTTCIVTLHKFCFDNYKMRSGNKYLYEWYMNDMDYAVKTFKEEIEKIIDAINILSSTGLITTFEGKHGDEIFYNIMTALLHNNSKHLYRPFKVEKSAIN